MLKFDSFTNKKYKDENLTCFANHLKKNVCEVESLVLLRNGNYFAFLLNGNKILRLTRVNYGHYDFNHKKETLEKTLDGKNRQVEKEFNDNKIIHSQYVNKDGIEFIPKYELFSTYNNHAFGIYNLLPGHVFSPSESLLIDNNKKIDGSLFGLQLGRFLNLLHRLDISLFSCNRKKNERGNSRFHFKIMSQIKFIEDNYGYLKFIDSSFEGLHKGLCDLIQRTEKFVGLNKVYTHNALESGHIIADKKGLSGVVDYEHFSMSSNGWNDLSDIYGNFITIDSNIYCKFLHRIQASNLVNKSLCKDSDFYQSIGFLKKTVRLIWNSVLDCYFCPVTEKQINEFERRQIEFVGLSTRLCRITLSLIKRRNQNPLKSNMNWYKRYIKKRVKSLLKEIQFSIEFYK